MPRISWKRAYQDEARRSVALGEQIARLNRHIREAEALNADLLEALKETLVIAMAYGPEGKSPADEEAVFARAKAAIAKAESR